MPSPASSSPLRLLFICSRNQWRSPTAEQVWRRHPGLSVRSAGTSASARRRVGIADLEWADIVLVMESSHKGRLLAEFPAAMRDKPVHVLDIPDEYQYMDPELVEQLRAQVGALLGL
ncbi:MAG: phosphotyrosine protein phosphatase [Pseudomonas sp.]|uniref:low molecular weight protein tyrosine phosphatase family protein n=1 Tax=Pseudomonas sp. TaxID=306 RepID=UPI0033939B69